jgi:serine/threonine-protein kinase
MSKQLLVIAGLDRGRILPMADSDLLLIGRSTSVQIDTRLRDPSVARVHCEVEVEGDRVVVTDSDAPGGTFVNGRRIKSQELQPGDVIKIGDVELLFQDESRQPPARPRSDARLATLPEGGVPASTHPTEPDLLSLLPNPPTAPPPSLHNLEGQALSYYAVGPVLGSGWAGRVFRARDTRNNRTVALKVLRPELFRTGDDIIRFINTLKPALAVRHPHWVTRVGAGKTGPFCWVAMEWLAAKSATQAIRRTETAGPMSWRQALTIAVHVGRALDGAAQHGLVHGNLTPQDILLCRRGEHVKLNDVLLAPAVGLTLPRLLSQPGLLVEDLMHLPPERTQDQPVRDVRADLYSLGAIVYALVAGRAPFAAESRVELFEQIRRALPASPRQFQPEVPDAFERAVLRLLAKRPEDRFQTPAEMLADLEQVAHAQGVTV